MYKLRMTLNSNVPCKKVSDRNVDMLRWWHGVSACRSELEAEKLSTKWTLGD